MFSRLSFTAVLALASLAAVSAAPPVKILGTKEALGHSVVVARQDNGGTCQGKELPRCCRDVGSRDDPAVMGNLKALGVDLEELLTGDLVGTRCSTLVSVDVCASNNGKPVCCSGQDAHGLIATSCSPISVNTLQ